MRATIAQILPIVLAIAVPLASFETGLGAQKPFGSFFFEKPSLLVRALLTILVLVPIWAVLFVQIAGLTYPYRGGILMAVVAIGIGPVAAMKRMQPGSPTTRFALELNVVLMAVSIVFIPLAVALLGSIFHHELHLGVATVAKVVLGRGLIPLGLGVLVGRLVPSFARVGARYMATLLNGVMTVVVVIAVLATWRDLLSMGARGWLAAAAVAAGAAALGHLMGGRDGETRGVLASSSVLRFPALALLLASLTPQPKPLIAEILTYVISGMIVLALYGAIMRGRAHRAHPQGTMGGGRGAPTVATSGRA